MKINKLQVHEFRGLVDLVLEPHGENMVICGPNGTGKSGVVDALDFLFTGKIARLVGEGTSGISLAKHGKHIDADLTNSFVEAEIQLPNIKKPTLIKRFLSDPENLIFDKSNEEEVKEIETLLNLAKNGAHVLTRRDILKFITSESSTRAQQVQILLDITEIEMMRKTFVKVNGDLKREHDGDKLQLASSQESIRVTLELPTYDELQILESVNKFRSALGGGSLDSIESDLMQNLTDIKSNQQAKLNLELVQKEIQAVKDSLNGDSLNKLLTKESKLREKLISLKNDIYARNIFLQIKLVELGLELINDEGKCPLCDHPWGKNKLLAHLKSKHLKGKSIESEKEEIELLSNQIVQILTNLKERLSALKVSLKQIDSNSKHLDSWLDSLNSLIIYFKDPVSSYPIDKIGKIDFKNLFYPQETSALLSTVEKIIETKVPKTSTVQTARDTLLRLEYIFKELRIRESKLKETSRAFEKADNISRIFSEERDITLNGLYTDISNDFVTLYNELHDSHEPEFSATIKPNGAKLDLLVNFYGRGEHPPHALHSEGHQDSMGICLFLCLGKKLLGNGFDLTILDDVVMSVDSGHRKELCGVLHKHFSNKQFIITTHDKNWARQLKSEGIVSSKCSIDFYDWRVETGPKVDEETEMWLKISKDIERDDIPSAAQKLRRGSETFFLNVADNIQAKIVYRQSQLYSLGDLVAPCIKKLTKLLNTAKTIATTWKKEEKIVEIDLLLSTIAEVNMSLSKEQWVVNGNIHFNYWVDSTKNDFLPVVAVFQTLHSLFQCAKCGSTLKLILDSDYEESVLKCVCDDKYWNLTSTKNIASAQVEKVDL